MHINTLSCEWIPGASHNKVLVVLHGRGDSSAGFHWLPDALALGDLNYLLVNAPDPYYTGFSWYDLPPHQMPGVLRSRSLLDQLFAELLEHGYSPDNIGFLGFSQGCLMALEWGARTPLPLAAYVGISGYCLDVEAIIRERHAVSQRHVWLITHGRYDSVLSYDVSQQQIATLQKADFPVRFETYDKDHTIDQTQELSSIRAFIAKRLALDSA